KIMVRGVSNAPVPLTLVNVHLHSGAMVNGFTGSDGSLVLSNIPPSMIAGLDLHADGYPSEVVPMRPVLRVVSYSAQTFVVRVEALPGNYLLRRSIDLQTWSNVTTLTIPPNGTFVDFADPNPGQR